MLTTNKRLLLYAKRGLLIKSDDVVSVKQEELHGVKYKERGLIHKTGILEVHGKKLIQLEGSPAEMKALYRQILQFI
ncbi:MAG: hypothetical protein QXN87_08880 [Candidatus Bathyarchaeia archaeon]